MLQALSQLKNIYGDSNAETITSNCDVRVVYRVNNMDTLREFSEICGYKEVGNDGNIRKEHLITMEDLGAMSVGQALVLILGSTKFIMWLPDFTEMFPDDGKKSTREEKKRKTTKKVVKYFDIVSYLRNNPST